MQLIYKGVQAKQTRKIFYRSGAIGDVIHCLPALKLAKSLDPKSSIEFIVGSEQIKELLIKYCPYIDKAYSISKEEFAGKKISQESDLIRLKESIKEMQVSDFVFLHSNWLRPLIWNWMHIKAKKILRYQKNNSVTAVENFARTYFKDRGSEGLLQQLDYKVLDCSEQKEIDDDYICIALGVGKHRPHRAYPAKLWQEFIELVLQKTKLKVVLLGGPDELEIFNDFTKGINDLENRIQNYIGKTSVSGLVPILANAKKVFSADTGILHIAAATGVEISSVFAITSELRTGPFSLKSQALRSQNCKCAEEGKLDSLKHCPYSKDGYASCIWDIKPEALISGI